MKLNFLFSLILGFVALSSNAQTESIAPKYGVVDIDSILMSIPEIKVIYQKIDSIQIEANKTAEPLATQFQEKMAQYEQLQISGDTVACKNLEADAQLIYQELNLIEQKARRSLSGYQQEVYKLMDEIKAYISKIGERMQLYFVIPKKDMPVYSSLGLPVILESPLYFSGDAVDITDLVIKEIIPPVKPAKTLTSNKKKTNSTK